MAATQDDRQRLGDLLVRRRVDLDPRYSNRRIFCEERGVEYFTVLKIEGGKRRNFERSTVAALERAYELDVGAIDRVLAGGDLLAASDGQRPEAGADTRDGVLDELRGLLDEAHALVERLERGVRDNANGPDTRRAS